MRVLQEAFKNAESCDRNSLLMPREVKDDKQTRIIGNFDNRSREVRDIISKYWGILKADSEISELLDKRRSWTPSWKGVIITVLLGVNITLIRIIAALVYHQIEKHRNELYQEIHLNNTDSSSVCQHTDIEKYRNELSKELCPNKSDNSTGCLLCPFEWQLHGDHCYYYSDVPNRTWNQSRDDCKMKGADLLVIKDQEQQEFIERTLKQKLTDVYWIGLYRDGDVWRWVDGEHYSGILFQIKTQESGGCVSMTKSGYYQISCSSKTRWTCLKKAVRI
ncbi:uncharacterized protein LOC143766415 [Ranitomeya variabilis]|uniref:uncharacterized protein LOC143766415 n=1 Tax=Ranitomeya variabilis TaxID=490064 RepID=UPI0040563895